MNRKQKQRMHALHIELVKFQREIIARGLKVLVILEGRDAAGKDGTIKQITKHLSPRETRIVALGKPSDRETSEWYFQRYAEHLPAKGEFVIFNRSWYNRAGVEKVMGFCSKQQYAQFFTDVELFEQLLVNAGITILKYYLDISKAEQQRRLQDRKRDPLKQWKISAIDNAAQKKWKHYSEARNVMLQNTGFAFSPWYVASADDKEAMHDALVTHLLAHVDYVDKHHKLLSVDAGLVYAARDERLSGRLQP